MTMNFYNYNGLVCNTIYYLVEIFRECLQKHLTFIFNPRPTVQSWFSIGANVLSSTYIRWISCSDLSMWYNNISLGPDSMYNL